MTLQEPWRGERGKQRVFSSPPPIEMELIELELIELELIELEMIELELTELELEWMVDRIWGWEKGREREIEEERGGGGRECFAIGGCGCCLAGGGRVGVPGGRVPGGRVEEIEESVGGA